MPTRSEPATREPSAPVAGAAARADELLARAVLCRALKLGLDRPTDDTLQALCSKEGKRALEQAGRVLDGGAEGPLGAAVARLAQGSEPDLGQLRFAYHRLFGHTLRGLVCPYEGEYGQPGVFQQANELADLGGFYAAFGLRAAESRHERPDHVACELEFLEFLYRKQLWALEAGDAEMIEVTVLAAASFLRQHLGRFGRAFSNTLIDADPEGFYGKLGRLCKAFLAHECERLRVPLGPEVLTLRDGTLDDVPAACGASDELIQIGPGGGRR